jgi:uncharacterized protein YcnI
MFVSRMIRFGAVFGAVGVITVLAAGSASAHVVVSPATAVGGSETQLTFRAPNEEATAHFIRLVVHLPAAQPLASLATLPIPGWTASLTKSKLAKPITTDDGTATEYTSTITWIATDGGVGPGQYQNFDVSVGPLPASGTMTFTADQTYTDGTVVHWNQIAKPGAAEPENPAPTLTLTAAVAAKPSGSDGLARGLGIAGIVVGVTGLAAAGLALRRKQGAA